MSENRTGEPEVKINFIHMDGVSVKVYMEYHIFFVVRGNVRLIVSEDSNSKENRTLRSQTVTGEHQDIFLYERDILLLLPGQRVNMWGGETNLIMDALLPVAFVWEEIAVFDGRFVCNSSVDRQKDYDPLRKLLAKMAVISCEKAATSVVYFKALSYMLLYCLRTNYYETQLVLEENNRYSDRKNEIISFIHQHYDEDLSLEKMADHLNLSSSYLSRFFKSAFDENFLSYLKKYRVERSINGLLYTRDTITAIAGRNGFNTSNAYIGAFKNLYGMTPKVYRQKYQGQMMKNISESAEVNSLSGGLEEHIQNVSAKTSLPLLTSLSEKLSGVTDDVDLPKQEKHVIYVDKNVKDIIPLWKTGINVASPRVFMFNDIYSGIRDIQEKIGFKYGRVLFVLSKEIVFQEKNDAQYYYYHFDRMLRTLMDNGLTPYLDLNYERKFYQYGSDGQILVDAEEFDRDISQFLNYWIRTYGAEAMENWIFDIGIMSNLITMKNEDILLFTKRFIRGYRTIKSILPRAKVGGFDIMPQFLLDRVPEILDILIANDIYPDFISMSAFPYVLVPDGNGKQKMVYSSDSSFVLRKVRELKKHLDKYRFNDNYQPKIYINTLGTTITHRNYIDDTCYQSTFIVKNMIDLVDEVDLICYYQMADFNFSITEEQLLLNGRNGILSQFGLHKPGYIALQMMSGIPPRMIAKGESYMVTKGKFDTYYILMCNHVCVSDWYCLKIDENVPLKDAYTVFEHPDTKSIGITLNGIKDGDYRMISYHLNRENGSIFDEWEKTGFWKNLNARELEYLKTALHPKRNCSMRSTLNGQLNFHMHLLPFEVVLVEVCLVEQEKGSEITK